MKTKRIYLDTAFTVEVYESTLKKRVPVTITRTETLRGGLSVGLFSGGASMTETKQYPIDAAQMFERVEAQLREYPKIELRKTSQSELPEFFWAEGILGATGSSTQIEDQIYSRDGYFSLDSDLEQDRVSVALVVNDFYFSTGYDQIRQNLSGYCQGFCIGIVGLFRLLCIDPQAYPIAAPLYLEKTGYV